MFRTLLLFVGLFGFGTSTRMRVDSDGGYTDIVVKIKEGEVPEDDCPKILANIEKLFSESSHALHEALDHRVFFKSVTVVVPTSWRDGKCQTVIRPPKGETPYRTADILVTGGVDPVHHHAPFTQQSRGCGQPGDVLQLPFQFLRAWNETWETWGDPAKLFVHEFAKLRFGIFDEFGFSGDPMYPNYFMSEGRIVPTGTSDAPIDGVWVTEHGIQNCDPTSGKRCYFKPLGANDQVTCSLGYAHFLPSVTKYCDKTVVPMGPTKHNVLCEGKSALDVILSHEDMVSREPNTKPNLKTTIEVVREPEPRYVFVVETSAAMNDRDQWKWINKAAQKFIRYDLPLNANVAIVTFANSSKVQHPMVQIHNDQVRARLADILPDKYHLSGVETRCLLCGIQKAIHEVLRNSMAGAHIVLITQGSADALSISDEQTIEDYVKYYHIKVSSIIVSPASEKLPLAFYDAIASMSGGTSHIVSRKDHRNTIELYVRLMDAFASLIDSIRPATTVHRDFIEMLGQTSSTGHFTIDRNLGRDTKFGIYVDDEEDHLIKSVTFTDSKGFLYGPFTSMSSLYDIINLKTVNFPVGEAPPFDEPEHLGTPWQYYIEWYPITLGSARHPQRSAVLITSSSRFGTDDFVVRMWTNSDAPSDIVTSQHPLAIFAQVTKGESPVLEADVRVDVTVTMPNGSHIGESIKLLDNGNGDPDLASGDGIYSRYLTRYYSVGRYSFTIHVTDNNLRAFVIRPMRNAKALPINPTPTEPICCGSTIRIPEHRRKQTGRFERRQEGPIIHLLSIPHHVLDRMPPSRIGDLRISPLPETRSLLATWTAPGDDFDRGRVTGYRFVFAENISALIDPFYEPSTLIGFSRPDEAGIQTSYQFEFEHMDADFFIGLVAFDEEDNQGKLSNIVTVHLSSNEVPNVPEQTPISAPEEDKDEGLMIGIVCGVFAVIAVCLWAGIWYFRNHKQRGSKGVNVNLVIEQTDAGSDIDVKNTSSHQLVPPSYTAGYKQIDTPTATITAEANTPIYWSASQLLAEHEHRQFDTLGRKTSYQGPLDPITEELDENPYGHTTSTPTNGRRPPSLSESLLGNSSRIIDNGFRSVPRKTPPKVPPKPSLAAILGLSDRPDEPVYGPVSKTLPRGHSEEPDYGPVSKTLPKYRADDPPYGPVSKTLPRPPKVVSFAEPVPTRNISHV